MKTNKSTFLFIVTMKVNIFHIGSLYESPSKNKVFRIRREYVSEHYTDSADLV